MRANLTHMPIITATALCGYLIERALARWPCSHLNGSCARATCTTTQQSKATTARVYVVSRHHFYGIHLKHTFATIHLIINSRHTRHNWIYMSAPRIFTPQVLPNTTTHICLAVASCEHIHTYIRPFAQPFARGRRQWWWMGCLIAFRMRILYMLLIWYVQFVNIWLAAQRDDFCFCMRALLHN